MVAVGSTNPTKINAVKKVFSFYYPGVMVVGTEVDSGVSEQPTTEEETVVGATTRSKNALLLISQAKYGVGIEGGLRKTNSGWFESSTVVVSDRKGKTGIGSSGGLILPKAVIDSVKKGETLEQAIDRIFKTKKIGRGIGMFGIMTKGYVTRTSGVEQGVAFALARFLHPKIYEK